MGAVRRAARARPSLVLALGAAVIALAAFSPAAGAQEASAGVEVEWRGAPGCPSRAAVVRSVQEMLRGSHASPRSVRTRARVTKTGSIYHVEVMLKTSDGGGRREFDAASCDEVADAVALITAMAIDPEEAMSAHERAAATGPTTGASATPPSAAGVESPETAPAAGSTAQPDASAQPEERPEAATPARVEQVPEKVARDEQPPPGRYAPSALEPWRLILGASSAGDLGVMPSFAVGGSILIGGEYRRFRLEAHGELWADQHAANPPNPAQRVPLSFVSGGVRLCYALAEGQLRTTELFLSPCATFDVGMLSGQGQGNVGGGDGLFDALGGGVLAGVSLTSSLFLRADGGVVVPLAAPRFVALASDGTVANQVFRSASVGARFGAGAELRFF